MWGITSISKEKKRVQEQMAQQKQQNQLAMVAANQHQNTLNAAKSNFTYSMLNQPLLFGTSNQTVEAFSFSIKTPLLQDNSVYWSYSIPFLKPNQKSLTLATQTFQTVLSNYVGDDYPSKISFAFRNLAGFSNARGQVTPRFLVLNLVSTSIKTQGNLVSRDLIYRSQIQNIWSLGALRNLLLQIYINDQQTPLSTQLTTPVEIGFKIVHVSV